VEADVTADSAPKPVAELEEKGRTERVRQALERLPERDRDVLLLWAAGLSYAEIAAQTGLAPGAIGSTLARARKKLVEAHDALEGSNAARECRPVARLARPRSVGDDGDRSRR